MRSFLPATLALTLATTTIACQKHGPKDEGETAAQSDGAGQDGPSKPAKDDRLPVLEAAAIGAQPGYMDGALFYASGRATLAQDFFHSLPLGPREAKDFAELGQLLGADPRVDDMLAHFAIPADGRISMSVRPVLDHAADLQAALDGDGPLIDELAGGDPKGEGEGEGEGAKQIEPVEDGGAPAKPTYSTEAETLLRQARSLGFHMRVHVPSTEPSRLEPLLASMREEWQKDRRWEASCAAIGPSRVCGGESDGVLVARDVAGGVQFDLYLAFESHYEQPDDAERRALLQAALAVPPARSLPPAVSGLRGDFGALIHGPTLVQLLRGVYLAKAVTSLPWGGREACKRQQQRSATILALHETNRLFDGATLEVRAEPKRLVAEAGWLPAKGSSASYFTLADIDADVPSITGLCDGAMVCGRSRGFPARQQFKDLATGVYADPKALGDAFDEADEEAMLVMLIETWPNAVGSLALLPGNTFEPPESFMVDNVLTMLDRVLGFGFSVRSLNESRRGLVAGDWVAYARSNATDLRALTGLMQVGDVRLTPANIDGVPGRIEATVLPDRDVAGSYYAIYDPVVPGTGEWGWAVVADGDDRLRWLAGLEHDDGSAPLLYFEIGDLWRLLSVFEEFREEFGFAQSWLSKRWVRAQVSATDAGPRVRVAMGKLD